MNISRRTAIQGVAAGFLIPGISTSAYASSSLLLTENRFRIWDAHSHLASLPGNRAEERMGVLVRHMDRLGIERVILSQGYDQYENHPTPEGIRIENDRVMRAVDRYPNRAYGSLFVSPDNIEFCIKEFERCVRDGPMVCVGELETDVRCNSLTLDPLVERAVALDVPILQHTWINSLGDGPGESSPFDLVELARRHPGGRFICGHTGGNWELGIRAIRDTPNIYAEIAGSDPTAGFTEMAVRELGAERVIYGSDVGGRSFGSQVAKVLGANVSEEAKELILGGNLRRLLQPVLRAKGLAS